MWRPFYKIIDIYLIKMIWKTKNLKTKEKSNFCRQILDLKKKVYYSAIFDVLYKGFITFLSIKKAKTLLTPVNFFYIFIKINVFSYCISMGRIFKGSSEHPCPPLIRGPGRTPPCPPRCASVNIFLLFIFDLFIYMFICIKQRTASLIFLYESTTLLLPT